MSPRRRHPPRHLRPQLRVRELGLVLLMSRSITDDDDPSESPIGK